VFLEQEQNLEVFSKVIVISSIYNRDMNTNPNCLYVGDTLEAVLGTKTLEQLFLELMVRDDKVTIFANNDAFAKIATFWLKSSTNMDNAAFETWVSCYKFRADVYSSSNNQLIELLKTHWNSAPSADFTSINFGPSFEFALASAFVNKEFAKKEKFKELLSKFIKRDYENLILEARKHLDTYILDKDLQEVLGGSGKTLQNFRELPRMSIYREPFFRDIISTVPPDRSYKPGKASKIDLSNATEAEANELCTLTNDINMAIVNSTASTGLSGIVNVDSEQDWKYITSVKSGVLTDTEYNQVIDEILAEKIAIVHVPGNLYKQVLFVLLPYIKSLKQENNISLLQKFALK
jgi:hypothetical protein